MYTQKTLFYIAILHTLALPHKITKGKELPQRGMLNQYLHTFTQLYKYTVKYSFV